ncbi:uncharacterized protein LOC127240639 isoform X2 [Andrographis paniculata]|uniref:uncharacterized protein LOC127240639 isoform X2 n=1 Tax=Andrographis paniculata TaxID=175694 RepID=UPI0021E93D59|nr:uncharacterized protein LOC127240639 isoform X2 [Andrographis paniculata]
MSGIPRELIRQVQISTRAAANLSDYDPSDVTLPELPSLSSEIVSSDLPPHLCCDNCKGRLPRGAESIICLYCGRRPNYDALPEPISFTSSVGYKWLLRALRLDGSEMVDPAEKSEWERGVSSTKGLTPLSDFLDFKIHWPAETGNGETNISDNLSKESRFTNLNGVDPGKFFPKLNRDVTFDPSTEQPLKENKIGTADKETVETYEQPNLFQNVQSFEPLDSSPQDDTNDDFSEWKADFQFAGSQNQEGNYKSAGNFADFSADSENNFQVSKPMDYSIGPEIDLGAQIDSVFGPGKEFDDGKPKENPVAFPVSNDLWNNLSSIKSHSVDGFDASVSTKDGGHDVLAFETSRDLSTSADLLQDFQLQPNYADISLNKASNEDHKTINFESFGDETIDLNSSEEWNDFAGFSSFQGPSQIAPEYQYSTSEKDTPEIDLFNFDSKFDDGDFGSFSQPDLFSASNSNNNSLLEVNEIISENPASIRSDVSTIILPDASGQPSKTEDIVVKPVKDDDVKTLISQMHDLSFMLETELSVPASSETHDND